MERGRTCTLTVHSCISSMHRKDLKQTNNRRYLSCCSQRPVHVEETQRARVHSGVAHLVAIGCCLCKIPIVTITSKLLFIPRRTGRGTHCVHTVSLSLCYKEVQYSLYCGEGSNDGLQTGGTKLVPASLHRLLLRLKRAVVNCEQISHSALWSAGEIAHVQRPRMRRKPATGGFCSQKQKRLENLLPPSTRSQSFPITNIRSLIFFVPGNSF